MVAVNGGVTAAVLGMVNNRWYEVVMFRPDLAMVSSRSADGWHLVEQGRCDCEWSRRRSAPCSHLAAIAAAQGERATAPRRRYVGEDG